MAADGVYEIKKPAILHFEDDRFEVIAPQERRR